MKRTALGLILAAYCATSSAKTFYSECTFTNYADEDGTFTPKEPFKFTIVSNFDKDTHYIAGNQGQADLYAIKAKGQISFIEATPTGNVMTTTIVLDAMDESDRGRAVHSRNNVAPVIGKLVSSQYYGHCAITSV